MTTADCGFKNVSGGPTGQQLLVARGPTISVDIGFDPNFKPGPSSSAVPVPLIQGVGALVDTGASISCIDDQLAKRISLPAIDKRKISGSGGAHEAIMYLAQIHVPTLNDIIYGAFAGVDLVAGGQHHQAIIGRTFLQHYKMSYDGLTGAVTLTKIRPAAPLPGLGGGPWKA